MLGVFAMKYQWFFMFIIFCLFSIFPTTNIVFAEEDASWCRITGDNAYIHKNIPSSNNNDVCFKLPKTYFAEILDCADEYFKISFDSIVGYVKSDEVTKVYSTPLMPFPVDITFSVNNSVQAVIFDNPSTSGKRLGVIASNEKANFLGNTSGEEAISGLGNDWLFAKYVSGEQTISGFVYAPLTKNLKDIPPNTEEVLLTPVSAKPAIISISPELTDGKNILIIISLMIVGALLFLAVFIPIRKNKQTKRVIRPPKFDNMDF